MTRFLRKCVDGGERTHGARCSTSVGARCAGTHSPRSGPARRSRISRSRPTTRRQGSASSSPHPARIQDRGKRGPHSRDARRGKRSILRGSSPSPVCSTSLGAVRAAGGRVRSASRSRCPSAGRRSRHARPLVCAAQGRAHVRYAHLLVQRSAPVAHTRCPPACARDSQPTAPNPRANTISRTPLAQPHADARAQPATGRKQNRGAAGLARRSGFPVPPSRLYSNRRRA